MRSAIDQISGMSRSARHDNLLIFRHLKFSNQIKSFICSYHTDTMTQ